MKRIVLILVFILQLLPGQQQNGNIAITAGTSLYAQCQGPGAGGPCGSSGGAFWQWLGTAFTNIGNFFGNIGNAIGNFVNNVPGGNTPMPEGMTTENQNWAWTDNGWLPNDGNDTGGPYDPWADNYWQNLGLSEGEMNILHNWQYYYDIYQQGGNPPPPPPGRYYVKVLFDTASYDTTKYYEGDTIYLMQRATPATLTIYRENGTVSTTDLAWKRNDTTKCTGIVSCDYNISTPGIIQEKVDSANSKLLTKNPIKVYRKPIVYFRIGANYNGEYGFDDSSHNHPALRDSIRYKSGTQVRHIVTDTAYFVPWMSILDSQSVTIKIEKKWIEASAANDKNFSISFKPSTPQIKINGSSNFPVLNYAQLQALTALDVYATEWEPKFDSLKTVGFINVITNAGDTIGKLNLSSGKPRKRKIVLVYVNTGTGYRLNMRREMIIDSLNKVGHNQIFRKWVADSVNSAGGRDTLDLRSEFISENPRFMNDDSLLTNIERYYELHKGINIKLDVNQGTTYMFNNKEEVVHFVFIMNYNLAPPGVSQTVGNTQKSGYLSILWASAFHRTIIHEMGHILGLKHTFSDTSSNGSVINNYRIPPYITKNYMDYARPGMPDITNMFYFANWKDIYR
jgi:hypothetical protein